MTKAQILRVKEVNHQWREDPAQTEVVLRAKSGEVTVEVYVVLDEIGTDEELLVAARKAIGPVISEIKDELLRLA